MNYVIVGINHKNTPIEVREKLSLTTERVHHVLTRLLNCPDVRESTILSTCNRVEIYGATADVPRAQGAISDFFTSELAVSEVDSYLYALTGREAVAHLFSVTASLDSLVIGENQIAKQVKEAFQLASAASASGPYLNRLFNRALFVAKRVRSETAIGKGNVSVGSAGIALAKKIFGTLSAKKVVLFGAGEVGELVLRHLNEASDVAVPAIVNRNPEKAHALSAQGLGRAHVLDEFGDLLMEADILITSVSGNSEHLQKKTIEALMRRRRHRPIFIIDLGLPRNVDVAVGRLGNVYLYNIDDLKAVADESRSAREDEIVTAKNIIDEETRLFYDSYLGQTALPMIAGLNRKFEDIRRREMDRTLSRLAHLSDDDKNALDDMTKAIVARILHDPILHLKTKSDVDSPVLGVLKKIFRLDDEVDDE